MDVPPGVDEDGLNDNIDWEYGESDTIPSLRRGECGLMGTLIYLVLMLNSLVLSKHVLSKATLFYLNK